MLLIATAWVLYNLKRPSKVHIIMFTLLMWTSVGTFYPLTPFLALEMIVEELIWLFEPFPFLKFALSGFGSILSLRDASFLLVRYFLN